MNSKTSTLIFIYLFCTKCDTPPPHPHQKKNTKKEKKKKLNDISIRLPLKINSAVFLLVPFVYVAPVFRLWKKSFDLFFG